MVFTCTLITCVLSSLYLDIERERAPMTADPPSVILTHTHAAEEECAYTFTHPSNVRFIVLSSEEP